MSTRAKRKAEPAGVSWAARCWHWKPGVDRDADEDVLHQQDEQWRDATSEANAHAAGQRLARHALATSPGLFDVMRGVPDRREVGGVRWTVHAEVRP